MCNVKMARPAAKLLSSCFCSLNRHIVVANTPKCISVTQVRTHKRWRAPVDRQLYWRRIAQGPEPDRHRSEWSNWNYDAEIFAFGKRLGEEFSADTLKKAFTHRSYVEKERATRSELDVGDDSVPFELTDNLELVQKGKELGTNYIKAYLRHVYPALPEEAICAVTSHLTDDAVLAHVGRHLGITDLILCSEFPPSEKILSDTLKAVVGGLAEDQDTERAGLFVQDFIITQLIGKDVMEIWELVNPMGILQGIVTNQAKSDVESRLLYQTGSQTVLAAYAVGVYSDQQLMGKGYGETVTIAEEMAARDALRRLFGASADPSLPLGSKGHQLDLDLTTINPSLNDQIHPNRLQ